MKNLLLEVAFRSDDNSESYSIDKIAIELTDSDIDNVKKTQAILSENKFMDSTNITIDGSVEYLDDEGKVTNGWRTDYHALKVYSDSVYYYAQNKWHSGDQIESDSFTID
jgi:hypothetical protein